MTALEILKAARAKIEKPENWTQGDYAKDENGESVPIEDGVCFCARGAFMTIPRENPDFIAYDAYYDAIEHLSTVIGGSLIDFNDSHIHEEVLAVFDKAIASLEALEVPA